jgi:hypothetical protein
MITAAAQAGLALFQAVESAILDLVSQIYHGTPRVILSLGGGRENGCHSDDAERKKWKFHPLLHIPCLIPNIEA